MMSTSKDKGGLDFRDLVMFNRALLAKQFWRILNEPDSLVASILQAKYFPHTTIMDAKLGSRSSLAWRSILASKDLINSDAIWKIGDGCDVRVWGDKWLPIQTSFSVQSPRTLAAENMRVCDLIDASSKQWKGSLISIIFNPEEATAILNIPLSPYLPKDRLVSRGTKNGIFTVRRLPLGHGEPSTSKARVF